MSFFRVSERCNGCLACVQNCPAGALGYTDEGARRKLLHNMGLCARCGNCWRVCPMKAVELEGVLRGTWDEVASLDLVRCAVCGEPLYTPDLEEALAQKLGREVEALCPRHRKAGLLAAWRRLSSDGGR